jgi:hypothetical protein
MAPIKFEEQLKDKLEKRTLSPSAESWAKLSERLDAEEKKSKNPLFWWLGIAAGIIIMIAVSVQFFKTGDLEKVMPQVAEEQINNTPEKNKKAQQDDIKFIEVAEETNGTEHINESLQPEEAPQIIDYKKATYKASKNKTQVAVNNALSSENPKSNETVTIKKELPISSDESMIKDAVTAALKELKSEGLSDTDKEVDSLLKLASKELFKDKLQKETTKTVDAEALLMSVEDEMGQSFRSKVFEALKNSYETVKTAVAERNN